MSRWRWTILLACLSGLVFAAVVVASRPVPADGSRKAAPPPEPQDDGPSLIIGDPDGRRLLGIQPGETETVPVRIDPAGSNVERFEGFIDFDPDLLRLESIERADGLPVQFDESRSDDGRVGLTVEGVGSEPALVAEATFAPEGPETGSTLTGSVLSALGPQGPLLDFGVVPLPICIGPLGVFGDVNVDRVVNILDAQRIALFIVGLIAQLTQPLAADVNADGAINILDAQLIAGLIVGLAVAENRIREALTPGCASFVNEAPSAQIESPSEGACFFAGEPLTLEGAGQDPEGGVDVEWSNPTGNPFPTATATVTLPFEAEDDPPPLFDFRVTDDRGVTTFARRGVIPCSMTDLFEMTEAAFTVTTPMGEMEVELTGPARIQARFQGDAMTGAAGDSDGDGRDEVPTEILEMDLTGNVPLLGGQVTVRINPDRRSLGEIEEQQNTTPGELDLPPFGTEGDRADSFFEVFFELVLPDGTVLHNEEPKRLETVITRKPPAEGETYESPDVIPLFDEGGSRSDISLGAASHTPIPPDEFVEEDAFPESEGWLTVTSPAGVSVRPHLTGPSEVEVFFETEEGQAQDDDGDGLDEVRTEIVSMELTGFVPVLGGEVTVRVSPDRRSFGEIEEQQNTTPGELDLDPFGAGGDADSFFDVFFELVLPDGTVLHNEEPKRLETVITEKPPAEGEIYVAPDEIPLLTAAGAQSGYNLGSARHVPVPPPTTVEKDQFDESRGEFVLNMPTGQSARVILTGPSTVDVFFRGDAEGDALDTDGDGLDEVMTQLVQLDLRGDTPRGPVRVGLNPDLPTFGEIEEQQNDTPGVLDLPPFGSEGDEADSFFDVFFELELPDGTLLHNREPKRLETVITEKPPGVGETYQAPDEIPLFTSSGAESGYSLGSAKHTPNPPPIEVDEFPATRGGFDLIAPDGSPSRLNSSGDAEAHVFFEGQQEGDARDDDGNGLDEVMTELVALNLQGDLSEMGQAHVRLNPERRSMGIIEERQNNTPGTLDVPPFTDDGEADSFFDVFFEVELPDGTTLKNVDPKRLEAIIRHKPPAEGDNYFSPGTLPLVFLDGTESGYSIGGSVLHVPDPLLSALPGALWFEHVVNESPCPQGIGSITITNESEQVISGSIRTPDAIDAAQAGFELLPGESVEVPLEFNCQTTSSFAEHTFVEGQRADGNAFGQARVLIHAVIQ